MPTIGNKRIDQIDAGDCLTVLTPIWQEIPETARKIKQRMGKVFEWGKVKGYRTDNPISDVTAVLPKQRNRVTHRPSVPYKQIGDALTIIELTDAWRGTKLALRFIVLTACRPSEVRLAKWDEVDMDAATWVVPAERTKMEVDFRVPLSPAALVVLKEAMEIRNGNDLIFPSVSGQTMSDSTMSKLMKENDMPGRGVPHGFRSTFNVWAVEAGHPSDLADAALSHQPPKVQQAYQRSTMFDRRRDLMETWADFVSHQEQKRKPKKRLPRTKRKPGRVVKLEADIRIEPTNGETK